MRKGFVVPAVLCTALGTASAAGTACSCNYNAPQTWPLIELTFLNSQQHTPAVR
jgi:hypothetical protein